MSPAYRTPTASNALHIPLDHLTCLTTTDVGFTLIGAGTHDEAEAAATQALIQQLAASVARHGAKVAATRWLATDDEALRRDRAAAASVAAVLAGGNVSNRDRLRRGRRPRRPLSGVEHGAVRFCSLRHHRQRAVVVWCKQQRLGNRDIAELTPGHVLPGADGRPATLATRTADLQLDRWVRPAITTALKTARQNGNRLCLTNRPGDSQRDTKAISAHLDRALHVAGVHATPSSLAL